MFFTFELSSSLKSITINLQPKFCIDLPQPIWVLRPDAGTGLLAVETRDSEKLLVSFWVIQVQTGEVILENYQPPELWWVGLEAITPQTLLLHGYGTEGFGKHQGITAFDFITRKNQWHHPNFSFYSLSQTGILAQSTTNPLAGLVYLHLETGAITEENITPTEAQAQIKTEEIAKAAGYQVPFQYLAGGSYFNDLQQFIQVKTGLSATLAIDYLEQATYFVIGFYQNLEYNKYAYQVLVFSLEGEMRLHEVLAQDLKGIGSDTFFILRETLILIKNRKMLCGYAP